MLHLWLCTDRKINTEKIMAAVCEKAARGIGGQILLVPEQFSHMTERTLCECGGNQISRFAEVLSFSRLANRVFSVEGGCAETETDAVGRLLMMSLAVEQVQSRLKIYGISAAKPEFLLQLMHMLDEFRSFCVTAEQLKEISRKSEGVLAEKAEEFALLTESFDSVSAQLGQNPEMRLTRLAEALETSSFPKDKAFYLDGFTDFNGAEYEILAQLLNCGAEVTVALQCDSEDSYAQQFSAARQTMKALMQLAARQGEKAKVYITPVSEAKQPLELLRASVFAGTVVPHKDSQEQVKRIVGADAMAQCRTAVGEILRLLASGVRPREISVACTDTALYQPMLETLLQRAQVPAYFAGDTDILRQSVAHMLLSALDAASGAMETEAVLAYLKSGFAPLASEQVDRMENYILLWSIGGSRFERPWTMNPEGMHGKPNEKTEKNLTEIEQDRVLALSPLLKLRKALKNAKNTGQMVLALYAFTEEIGLSETLNRLAEDAYREGELQRSQEYVQIYGIFCDLMEQMYGVLGSSVRTPENFYRMFRTALSQSEIGTIPAGVDCVTVGSLMSQRRCDTDYVILLGAEEGLFPGGQSTGGLLTDGERLSLKALGIDLAPTAAGVLERELAAIDSVLNAPNKCLYLGACDGKEAYYTRRAVSLFPNAEILQGDVELISRCEREYIAHLAADPAAEGEGEAAQTAKKLLSAAEYRIGSLSEDSVKRLYGKTLSLSSSKIDLLASCRLAYFLQYGLRAKQRETAEMDPRLYGTFVHDVLEHTARQVMQEGGFRTVPLERVLEIAEARMEYYAETELAELWESARAEYLFRRNFAEVRLVVTELYRELSVSEFQPQWFELQFSDRGGALPSVKIVGEKAAARLEGFVDRADVWRDGEKLYVRVVDYKTGKKEFNETLVLNGLRLQMLLYLFALRQSGEGLLNAPLHPAGVLYFEAKAGNAKEKDKAPAGKKRSGLVLNSEPVLRAMEDYEKEPVYLPFKTDKNGERVGKLFTEAEFDLLEKHVFRTVAELADVLYSGDISANPFFLSTSDNACNYCPYSGICREDKTVRKLQKVKNTTEFSEKLREEMPNAEI